MGKRNRKQEQTEQSAVEANATESVAQVAESVSGEVIAAVADALVTLATDAPTEQAQEAPAQAQDSQDEEQTQELSAEPTAEQIAVATAYIQNALTERALNKPDHAADLCKERDRFSPAIVACMLSLGIDYRSVGDGMRSHDKRNGTGFCALYAVTKVRAIAQALALNSISPLDPHTQTILLNVRRLGHLTAKSALVVQSRSIEYTATDVQQQIHRYGAKYTPGTATTQRSSTREALRVLGMGPLHKGSVEDPIMLHDPVACPAVARINTILDKTLAA